MAPRKKEAYYPIFEECLQFTIDPYWRCVFADFIKGKFPRGMGVGKDIIYLKRGTKTARVVLTQQPMQLFQNIVFELQNVLELKSHFDRCRNQKDLEAARKEIDMILQLPWTKIRKKKFKEDIILSFVEEIKLRYRLRFSEMQQLLRTINSSMTFHVLESKDVQYQQGKIVSIDGLYWDSNNREFYTREGCNFPKPTTKAKLSHINPYDSWSTFVEKEVKLYKKFNIV